MKYANHPHHRPHIYLPPQPDPLPSSQVIQSYDPTPTDHPHFHVHAPTEQAHRRRYCRRTPQSPQLHLQPQYDYCTDERSLNATSLSIHIPATSQQRQQRGIETASLLPPTFCPASHRVHHFSDNITDYALLRTNGWDTMRKERLVRAEQGVGRILVGKWPPPPTLPSTQASYYSSSFSSDSMLTKVFTNEKIEQQEVKCKEFSLEDALEEEEEEGK